jgi:hypothetical protein
MKSLTKIFALLFVILVISSCEKNTQIDLENGEEQLAIDAYITNKPGKQVIRIMLTSSFTSLSNPAVSGAIVKLSIPDSLVAGIEQQIGLQIPDTLKTLTFKEGATPGTYEYVPSGIFKSIPIIPKIPYELKVTYKGETFAAVNYMDSVPQIDSLTFEYRKKEIRGSDSLSAGWRCTDMYSKDLVGRNNCYWFKSYKNGVFYNKPSEINLSYDGTFGPGSDGLNFIPPIAFGLTPDVLYPEKRLQVGDSLEVELHSIDVATYYYLQLATSQMVNTGLFATPPVNAISNLKNVNTTSKVKVNGFFTMAAVSKKKVIIKDKEKFTE